ncbi:MAG TPA: MtrAB system histidine kinase MtrB [Candidatus Nanopelagicales bacterium]|nr:MtrAB system histidine kinase MtrB [Candidatus Nanopelagicales bacterium]
MPLTGLGRSGEQALRRAVSGPRRLWRSSLALRVVATTLLLSLVVVGLVGALLLGRITSGLLDAKVRSSMGEASAGLNAASQQLTAADVGPATPSPSRLLDTVTASLAQRAGSPGLYDVLLLATPPKRGDAPERGTYLVAESSVPDELRAAVQSEPNLAWTYHQIDYLDGRSTAGLVVGAQLTVPTVGPYELYYLFPLAGEQETLDLVRRTVLAAGALLVLTLGLIAWVVTRQVVTPVRQAASIAGRLSAGHLTERMPIRGQDDLARLGASFNDMAASLQEQIGRLEDLSRVQQRFVSDVSHELRTPLTTVRMAADVLHESRADFDPATARSAELLQTQLDRFEALLSDLLEISRFDAGAAVLDLEPTDLRVLAQRAVESAAPLAADHHTEIELVIPAGPVVASVDPRRIDRILRNLVVNAIEHGEGEPGTVTGAADASAAAVGVRDRGVGLKPGESSLVFSRFWRADPARARRTGGTGLGLSIALEDALLHGGWLQAWGAPGAGAHLRLTVPRRSGAPLEHSPITLEPVDAAARGARRVAPYAGGRRGDPAPVSSGGGTR